MKQLPKSMLIWSSILVAWVFDLLLWKHGVGLSYTILVILVMVVGYLLACRAGIQPAKSTWLLVPAILFFAIMTWIRSEPMTSLLNIMLSVFLLALAAVTYSGGKWWNYSFSDYIQKYFYLALSSLSRLILSFFQKETRQTEDGAIDVVEESPERKPTQVWAILRGLILALPIVLVLALLLGQADPIFNQELQELLKIFKIERLGEYLFRLFYILVLAYLLAGVYLHSINQSDDRNLIGLEKPWLARFLGSVEAHIILGGIDVLFLLFVFIQFKYFFGGQGNIHIDGFTYAEYARKGFYEMVMVAAISLLILQVLSTITKRDEKHESLVFSGLSVGLVALVIVILISAFQRLQLYEIAYGFSRVRIYSHIFIIWLGILLIATAAIEIARKQRAFALAVVLSVMGFGVTINLINVDRFITEQNIQRRTSQNELDVAYLVSLSEDAVPLLAETYQRASNGSVLKDEIGAALACKLDMYHQPILDRYGDHQEEFWGEHHFSRSRAWILYEEVSGEIEQAYQVNSSDNRDSNEYYKYVETGHGRINCIDEYYVD